MENKDRIMSYLEFKLTKEMHYVDTFEKDEKIQKQYTEYKKNIERRKNNGKSK
jgi:hypothetical protein